MFFKTSIYDFWFIKVQLIGNRQTKNEGNGWHMEHLTKDAGGWIPSSWYSRTSNLVGICECLHTFACDTRYSFPFFFFLLGFFGFFFLIYVPRSEVWEGQKEQGTQPPRSTCSPPSDILIPHNHPPIHPHPLPPILIPHNRPPSILIPHPRPSDSCPILL